MNFTLSEAMTWSPDCRVSNTALMAAIPGKIKKVFFLKKKHVKVANKK